MNRRDRQKDTHRFDRGMISDYQIEHGTQQHYGYAQNMQLVQNGDMMMMTQWGSESALGTSFLPATYGWIASFSCVATYGPQKEQRQSVICFARRESGYCQIYIYDAIGKSFHLVYNDEQRPNRERMYVLDIREVDAYAHGEGKEFFCYWVDWENPVRRIPLHVQDDSVLDNSVAGLSPLYVPNEPDCLLTQRLSPVDMPEVSEVIQNGGALLTGSYQFAYRYFNTQTKQYSAVSLITNPVPIIPTNTDTDGTNEVRGGGLNTQTAKAIEARVIKSHFHHRYYDAIQLFVVRHIGATRELSMLPPSIGYYGQAGGISVITYTGSEATEIFTEAELSTSESYLDTAKTIEVIEGRLHLANIKYADLDVDPSTSISGQTITQEFSVPVDPLINSGVDGYYDEMNCHTKKGHWRGEVYRFGLVYFDKFMRASFPSPIKFPEAGRYDQAQHGSTWNLNWAEPGVGDWKFADRESREGSIHSTTSPNTIRAFGLCVSGISDHPSWAYGCAIFRRPRKRNIIGQTPVINGVAVCGGSPVSASLVDPDISQPPYIFRDRYVYGGNLDTYIPKILAHGHAKSILLHNIYSADPSFITNLWYHMWYPNYSPSSGLSFSDQGRNIVCNLYYLYPLEYLANDTGPYLNLEDFDNLYLRPIDAVALEAFSTYRGNELVDPVLLGSYSNDGLYEYGFIFSPKSADNYFYNNIAEPRSMLRPAGPGVVSLPCARKTLVVNNAKYQIAGGRHIDVGAPPSGNMHVRHIQRADGLQQLAEQQSQIDTELGFVDVLYIPLGGGLDTSQRAIVASAGDGLDIISDPTIYARNSGNFSAMFGSASLVDISAEEPSTQAQAPSTIFNPSRQYAEVIPAGSSIVCYIANIESGLSDSRYGQEDGSQEYIWTGAYQSLSESVVNTGSELEFNVWGGDCYITRLIANIRNNKPQSVQLQVKREIDQNADIMDYWDYPVINTALSHSEVIDIWVESEVNGHFLARNDNQYPNGWEARSSGHLITANTSYSYPSSERARSLIIPPANLYNRAYSADTGVYKLFSRDIRSRIVDSVQERIQFSNQKIFNSSTLGFDRFFENDFYDLDGTFGGIQKLLRASSKRAFSIQTDGVAMIYLGQQIAEDQQGLSLALSSGQVIGYAVYVSDNSDSSGEYGIQNLGGAISTGSGIFCFDQKRQQIFMITEGVSPISYAKISSIVRDRLSLPNGNVVDGDLVPFYDPTLKRVGVFANSIARGITFLTGLGVFETTLTSTEELAGGSHVPNGMLFLSKSGGAHLYNPVGGSKGTFLGSEQESYISLDVSGDQHRGVGKVLSVVSVQSENDPDVCEVSGYGIYATDLRTDGNGVRRQDYVHFNGFSSFLGKRLRAPNFEITIKALPGTTADMRIRNISVKYRIDHRES